MLQSRRANEAPSDLTVFDRQVAWIKWQQQQDNTSYGRGCVIDNSNETHGCQGNIWPQLAMASCPMLSSPRLEGGECSPLSKKRKVGVNRTEENSKMKKAKTDGEAVVELKREMNQTSNEKGESESSGEENSKMSAPPPPQKTDYIHVRARRGQATDSHSLAERVRREKISERMKYLQDLVPGCNKITGKAGMLDEIINYVQSLQRQVEFLSMKLAAAHPRLDFSIDQLLITKEINQACGASFPTVAMSSETVDPSYLQFNLMGDAAASCGLEPAMNPSELELRRTASMLTPVPDVAVDSSFNAHGTSFAWDNDMMNLYNVEFHQGRGFSFPFQLFQGSMVPNNAKMEF